MAYVPYQVDALVLTLASAPLRYPHGSLEYMRSDTQLDAKEAQPYGCLVAQKIVDWQ